MMRRVRSAACTLAVLAAAAGPAAGLGIGTIPARVAADVLPADTIIIGVLPFESSAVDTSLRPLAYALADLLVTDLTRVSRITVVERARLGDVLREIQLSRSALFDPWSSPRVGRLLNANRLVLGSLVGRGGDLVIESRLVKTATAQVDTAVRATANLNDILAAQKEIAFRILARLGVILTPRERAAIEQRPTRNLAALLAYGHGVENELNGNFTAARHAFRRAALLDPGFRQAGSRLRESGLIAIRADGFALPGVIELVNPGAGRVPRAPVPGIATDPSFPQTLGVILITVSRP